MPSLHGLRVFFGNRAADDLPFETESRARLERLDPQPYVAVLTFTAGLPDEFALLLDGFGDRFFVRDLRFADVGLDLELAAQAVEDDLEMQFAHAGDDRLLRLFVGPHAEGGILLREARKPLAELILIGLRLRLDRL